jgi:hypothetical protein
MVLTATFKTPPWKKFKGTCGNGGEVGHEAHQCPSNKVESTDEATKNSGTLGGNKSHVTCYNCQQKGCFANKLCTLPKKLKPDATDSNGMFVGVTFTDNPIDRKSTNAEREADTMGDYIDAVSKVRQLDEEWLLDSGGSTCGVTCDKTYMTDMKPSDRKITIGNGGEVATQGQEGTDMLTDKLGQTIKLTDVYYAPTFTKHIETDAGIVLTGQSFSID